MNAIKVNLTGFKVNPVIAGVSIQQKTSSNIAYFGVDADKRQLFVQFKSGGAYLYSEISNEVGMAIINAESIGKVVSNMVVGKFPSQKLEYGIIAN